MNECRIRKATQFLYVFGIAAILCSLFLTVSVAAAAPTSGAAQDPQLTEALRRAHALRINDRDAFLRDIRSLAPYLPEAAVTTESGKATPATFSFNAHEEHIGGVRFRMPEGQPRDLIWGFFMPPRKGFRWNIISVAGTMDGGFKKHHRFIDFTPDPEAGITGVRRREAIFTICPADKLTPGAEYILWIDFDNPGEAEVEMSLACLLAGQVQDTPAAIASALDQGRIAGALAHADVAGRDRDWLFSANAGKDYNTLLLESEAALARTPKDPNAVGRHHFILWRLKRWKEAEEFGAKTAIPIVEKSGDKELLFWVLFDQVWLVWGDDHADRTPGNSKRLMEYNGTALAEQMLVLADALDSDNLRYHALYTYAAWVEHSLAGHQWSKAMDYYKQAMAVAQRNEWSDRVAHAMGGVAEVLACIKKLDESEAWSNAAGLEPHSFVATQRNQWQQIYDKYPSNIAHYERETLRQPNERLQREVMGWNQRDVYDNFTIACMNLDKHQEAVETVERLNNRTIGLILGAKSEEGRFASVELRKQQRTAVNQKMDQLNSQLALAQQQSDSTSAASIQRDLKVQGAMLDQINSDIAVDELEVKAAGVPPPMKVAEMQALLDEDTALVVYGVTWSAFITEGVIATLTHTDFKATLKGKLTIGTYEKQGLQPLIDPYVALVTKPVRTPEENADLKQRNDNLYNRIIAPMREHIENRKHWIIIPSGPLCQVPIHLLKGPEGHYLFESHSSISYVQSMGVLRYALARNRKVGGDVTIVANPALAMQGATLKFAESEAQAIAQVYPKANLLVGDRATETAIRAALSTADVLHFACHGLLDVDYPMKSALALTPDDQNDGMLTAREICDYPIKAGLVVLSACQSGSGAMSAGWIELVGMSRAWLLAGAPSVMVSLWKLDDRSTSELMAEFYKNLKTMSRAEALQRAQIEMMKKYENPYYWGAFVLYGDYR